MSRYQTRTWPETILGEAGWSYSVSADGREVFGGWSRGKKANALDEVREGIRAREALRAASNISDKVVLA